MGEREEAAALPTSWWDRFPRAKDDKKALPWQEVPDSNCERRNVTLSNALRPQSQPPATASKTAGTGQKRAFLRVAGGILQSWAWITIIVIIGDNDCNCYDLLRKVSVIEPLKHRPPIEWVGQIVTFQYISR